MRKIVTIAVTAAAFGAIAAAPSAAQAQYYGGYINQPRGYGTPYYAPPPPPVYSRPRVVVTPPSYGYGYGSGAYTDYRKFGDPTTRDSLATCAYC